MSWFYGFIIIFSSFISAFAQILLKKSTLEKHGSLLKEYLNFKVIFAYGIFTLAILLNVYAFSGIKYGKGAILSSTSYAFTLIFAAIFLKNKITWRSACGNILILLGIAVYSYANF